MSSSQNKNFSLDLSFQDSANIINADNRSNDIPIETINYFIPSYCRVIHAISIDGRSIELDDSTVWKVTTDNPQEIKQYWNTGDIIKISKCNFPSWSGSRFFLINDSKNIYCYAELHLPPHTDHPNTNRIIDVNTYTNSVTLQNNQGFRTAWKVDPADHFQLRCWKVGHHVIVGVNAGNCSNWFSKYENILYNIETDYISKVNEM
ncbi:MAG: hypothetical protein WDZ28_03185 [Simkaniaceae bacterium]